ncbi:MAG: DUF2460 domain-containing protein [Ancalomicrobiaceae bacterium]|nr:DUF2460 domain-containing protein [Ancalomicrobiaceae bacterium]
MSDVSSFHEVVFPVGIALGSTGGPRRKTEIVTLGSGDERRNLRWADSRRHFDAGSGVRSFADLAEVVAFFEARRGRLYGFRFKDPLDDRSCGFGADPSPVDQPIGTGDGGAIVFQLTKTYGGTWARQIAKPVAGTVRIAVAGTERHLGTDFSVDATTGLVSFAPAAVPPIGAAVTAGFEFHVPVRFDTDDLTVDLSQFAAGQIPSIPLIEIRP